MIDLTKISLYSDTNYMKQAFSGEATFNLPNNNIGTVFTFNHNLGYRPAYSLSFTVNDNTVEWSGNMVEQNVMSASDDRLPRFVSWVTNTQLVVRVSNYGNPSSGARRLSYKIYYDYGA